jgi:hypothetical protein
MAAQPDDTRRPFNVRIASVVLLVLAAAVVPATMFAAVAAFGADYPWSDEWAWLGPVMAVQHGTLHFMNIFSAQDSSVIPFLWGQHNEHRVFVPALIALAESMFGGWNPKREELVSVAVVTGVLAMAWSMLRATVEGELRRAATFFAVSILLFSFAQYENWTWGFQTAWFMGCAFAFASVFLLSRSILSPPLFAAALAAAVCAAYSSAFGLVSLVVGILVLYGRPNRPRWSMAVWAASSGMALAVFFYGYRLDGTSGHAASVTQLVPYVQYAFTYLGSLLGAWSGLSLAAWLGALGAAIYAAGVARFVVLRRTAPADSERYLPWLGVGAFGVLNALMTSYGRLGWGPASALQSRYTTVTCLFWVSVVVVIALLTSDEGVKARSGAVRAGAVIVILLFGVSFWQSELRAYSQMGETNLRMRAGLQALGNPESAADTLLLDVYPDPTISRIGMKFLTLAGIGPFATDPAVMFRGRGDEPAFGVLLTFAYLHDNAVVNLGDDLPPHMPLLVSGWAFDGVALKPGTTVVPLIDGAEVRAATRYGLPTPDVADGFFLESFRNLGFELLIGPDQFRAGRHDFAVALKTPGNRFLHLIPRSKRVFTVPGSPAGAAR